jgi:hypothetical protein
MSAQQMTGSVFLLIGLAALIVSVGVAWTLARLSGTRGVAGTSFLTAVSFGLFVVGIVLCWLGVSTLVEG